MKSDEQDHDAEPSTTTPSGIRISGATPVDASAHDHVDQVVLPPSDLPHWTDPPTGQLPIVGGDSPAPIDGPTWREDRSDWDIESQSFDASMLAGGGPVPEAPSDGVGRHPWEFDEPTPQGPATEGFTAEDYESIPTDEELLAGLGAQSSAKFGATPPARTSIVRRRRKKADDAAATFDDVVPASGSPDSAGNAEETEVTDEDRTGEDRPIRRVERVRPPGGPKPSTGPRRRPRDLPAVKQRSTDQGERNLGVAIATGVALGVVLLLAAHVGTPICGVVVAIVGLLALHEGYLMFWKVGYRPAVVLGLGVSAIELWGGYHYGQSAVAASIVLLMAGTFAYYTLGAERVNPIMGMGSTLIVFAWISTCGAYGEMLLNPSLFPHKHGVALLLGLVLVTMGNDVGALYVGKRFGRTPLARHLSPNKTVEGFVGGLAGSLLLALVFVAQIHPWSVSSAIQLAVICAVVAPCGDLAQSSIKRTFVLKDSGNLLPGHGGILDRIDGLLFMLPATFFLAQAMHLN